MLIQSINNSFGSRKSPYVEKDSYVNGSDYVRRTKYFSKEGRLIGFKLQHSNGVVEYARETYGIKTPHIILLTKGYKNYNPVTARVIVDYADFYDDIDLNRINGHNPSIWAAVKLLKEKDLFKKK